MNEIENLVFWLKYKLVFGFLFITAYWYHWNFPKSLRAVCQWDKMGGAQSKLQMDWMRGDKMGGAQSQLQMSGRTNNVMVWYEWVRLYCGWVGRNVLVKLMWLYLRVGHDKLECGLCWVGFGWSVRRVKARAVYLLLQITSKSKVHHCIYDKIFHWIPTYWFSMILCYSWFYF